MFELKISAASAAELKTKLKELLGQIEAQPPIQLKGVPAHSLQPDANGTPVPNSEAAQVAPLPQPAVPVAAAPTYTHEQIMQAGTPLVDAGKMSQLVQLLQSFGVQAVTQLPPEQLGAFALELRKMGANI